MLSGVGVVLALGRCRARLVGVGAVLSCFARGAVAPATAARHYDVGDARGWLMAGRASERYFINDPVAGHTAGAAFGCGAE